MTPKRVQRKRAKGWRMPPGAVYVGRPTRWGNPCTLANLSNIILGKDQEGRQTFSTRPTTPEDVLKWFREAAEENPELYLGWSLEELRAELGGKDLACWCPPGAPCHADVLLELANAKG